jgi:hypothetical protein
MEERKLPVLSLRVAGNCILMQVQLQITSNTTVRKELTHIHEQLVQS